MLVVAVLVVVGLPLGLNTAASDSGQLEVVENETVTVDYDSDIDLGPDHAYNFSDTVEVRNSSDAVLEEGTDYEWNATDGTLRFLNSSATSEGESATVTYEYQAQTAETRTVGTTLSPFAQFLGMLFFVVVVVGTAALTLGGEW